MPLRAAGGLGIGDRPWVTWLQLGGLAQQTIKLRGRQLRCVARRLETPTPADASQDHIATLCSQHQWSAEHRKSMRISLVSLFDWCVKHGVVECNPASSLTKSRGGTPRPRPAPDDVWRDLIATAPPRELLMVRLAGEAGMRRGEVARCHRNDLIADAGGWSLVVHGKGGSNGSFRSPKASPPRSAAPPITAICSPGKVDDHISDDWVGTSISRLMPPGYTMHILRHLLPVARIGAHATGGPCRFCLGTSRLVPRNAMSRSPVTRSGPR